MEGPLRFAAERLSRNEKIPLFAHLLHAGIRPMSDRPEYVSEFLKIKLKIDPGSEKGRFVRAFLASIDRDDRSIALAYLFATQGVGEFKPSEIFQIFGTPGKKAAQIAALWDLFPGDQEALNRIKEKAQPLSLLEMKELLSKEAPTLYDRLEFHSILGSASIKTIVKTRDRKTGKWLALAVANPRARPQTKAHFELARKMITHLDEFGLTHYADRFRKLATQSEELVLQELDMRDEARKSTQANQVFKKIGPKNGWKFAPPGVPTQFVVSEHVVVFDFIDAPGSFESIGEFEGRTAARRAIAEATVEGIFLHGWIQMDPHAGNFLVNPATQTIYPLDFGQTIQLDGGWGLISENQILGLGQFLRHLAEGNPSELLGAAQGLSRKSHRQESAQIAVESFMKLHQADRFTEKTLFELFDLLEAHGTPLPTHLTLGILKPLATILREGYVTQGGLGDLLRSRVEMGIRRQGMALTVGELRNRFQKLCGFRARTPAR